MLKEIGHFLYHSPGTLRLMAKMSQAELYDTVIERADRAGLADRRARLVGDLEGEVLEVGAGTGMMFPHYRSTARVAAIEPDESFLERAQPVAEAASAEVTAQVADGTSLPFDSRRFDAVVFGLVLCSVPSIEGVLAEARRVLKPGGELRLIEHVKSDGPVAGALMDVANPLWLKLNGQGCNMNRNPARAIERAGFSIEQAEPFQIFSAGLPAFPMQQIAARG